MDYNTFDTVLCSTYPTLCTNITNNQLSIAKYILDCGADTKNNASQYENVVNQLLNRINSFKPNASISLQPKIINQLFQRYYHDKLDVIIFEDNYNIH